MTMGGEIKALLFDVFGTCVDWRGTVTKALISASTTKLESVDAQLSESLRNRASRITAEQWGEFAQQWRNTYKQFTRALATDPTIKWKSVDQHHYDALIELAKEWSIEGLWSDDELQKLSLIWHFLDPWKDSVNGMSKLNENYQTATLSNGNVALLEDLKKHSGIPFAHIFSAELFQSYKPSPKVYLGAVEKLGLRPEQCAMVACHLNDLQAARSCGLHAIYVERPMEEDYDSSGVEQCRLDGFVDIWVGINEGGFETVAQKLATL